MTTTEDTNTATAAALESLTRQPIEMIYLDLDGPLADFVHGALQLFHRPPHQVIADWVPGSYSMEDALGMDAAAFWERLEGNHRFWQCLHPTPDFRALLKNTRQHADELRILTAPSSCPTSHYGKAKWLKHHGLNPGRDCIMAASRDKRQLAGPRRVLIDDSDQNCDEFEQAGGHAILWPALWNSAHALRNTARVPYVVDHLAAISEFIAAGEVSE